MEKNLDIKNPPFNEKIWPVPSDFVKSRFHCTPLFPTPPPRPRPTQYPPPRIPCLVSSRIVRYANNHAKNVDEISFTTVIGILMSIIFPRIFSSTLAYMFIIIISFHDKTDLSRTQRKLGCACSVVHSSPGKLV